MLVSLRTLVALHAATSNVVIGNLGYRPMCTALDAKPVLLLRLLLCALACISISSRFF